MGKVFNYLGVSTGCITNDLEDKEKVGDHNASKFGKAIMVGGPAAAAATWTVKTIVGPNAQTGEHKELMKSFASDDTFLKRLSGIAYVPFMIAASLSSSLLPLNGKVPDSIK